MSNKKYRLGKLRAHSYHEPKAAPPSTAASVAAAMDIAALQRAPDEFKADTESIRKLLRSVIDGAMARVAGTDSNVSVAQGIAAARLLKQINDEERDRIADEAAQAEANAQQAADIERMMRDTDKMSADGQRWEKKFDQQVAAMEKLFGAKLTPPPAAPPAA